MSEGILLKTNKYATISTFIIIFETILGFVLSSLFNISVPSTLEVSVTLFLLGLLFVFLGVYLIHFFAGRTRKKITNKHVLISMGVSLIPSIFGIFVQLIKQSAPSSFYADVFSLALLILSIAGVEMIRTFIEEI